MTALCSGKICTIFPEKGALNFWKACTIALEYSLGQVLQIHAEIRPDIFISDTTKYTVSELTELLKSEKNPIYVAVNEEDVCADKQVRGQHIGESIFEYVKQEAKKMGCYEVTLNVWTGNTSAEKFYEKMGMKTKKRQMEYIL